MDSSAALQRDTEPEPTSREQTGVVTETPPRDYYERKAEGWCVYGACPRRADGWPDPVHHYCQRHRVKVLARKAKAAKAEREALRGQGKCRRCRRPSATYRCPACAILDGTKLPTNRVTAGVVTDKDPWRRDNDGWQRYRGKGQRGAPPAAVNDEQDLLTAVESLERGRQSMAYAHSPPVKALGRDAQREARAAAASILAMAARQAMEVAERNLPERKQAISLRARVRDALGEGVDQEVIDDAMIDRVISAVRQREAA